MPGSTITFTRSDGTQTVVTVAVGVNYVPAIATYEVEGHFDATAAGLRATSVPAELELTLLLDGSSHEGDGRGS